MAVGGAEDATKEEEGKEEAGQQAALYDDSGGPQGQKMS